MNDLLQQGLINIGVIPIAYLILKAIFKKSIMFTYSFYIVLFVLFVSFTSYAKAVVDVWYLELSTIFNIVIGTLVFAYINKILRKPLEGTISKLKELSEGNLTLHIEEIKSENELGVLNNSLF